MSSRADEGAKALESRDFPRAIELYSQALTSSNSPKWLIQRSIAYHRDKQYTQALQDAESAVLEAISRGRRELIATAQMRRAVALHALGLYGDARLCFTWVRKLNEKEPGLGMWQEMVKNDYVKLTDGAPGSKVNVKEVPDRAQTTAMIEKWNQKASGEFMSLTGNDSVSTSKASEAAASNLSTKIFTAPSPPAKILAPSAIVQTPREKIKQEWFQSASKVIITIFAKNVPKDSIEVHYDTSSVSVSFPTGTTGVNYDFTATPLFSNIVVAESSHLITMNKIEITLHKAKLGLKWPKLESEVFSHPSAETEYKSATNPSGALSNIANTASDKIPSYPTSSRTGPKNWDALAKQALKNAKVKDSPQNDDEHVLGASGTDAEVNPDVDDDSDDEGDALNGFFKKLYKGADPETKRAMMKSYVESNGTALSTNWEEVSKKPVPTEPPAGIEAKKWSS